MTSMFYFALLCICMSSLTMTSNTILQSVFKRMPFNKSLAVKSLYYPSQSARSRIQCSALCAKNNFCKYFTYERKNSKCSLLHSWKDYLGVQSLDDSQTYYSVDEGDIWNMVYFVKSNLSINVTASYSGDGTPGCQSPDAFTEENDNCLNYYRSNLIDIWDNLPIAKVKLAIKKDSKVTVSLVFDGRGSTKEDWFDLSRILECPWKFDAENTKLYFSMKNKYAFVFTTKKDSRMFWMTVASHHQELVQLLSPVILYAKKETFSHSSDAIVGDSLAIYVSFEKQSDTAAIKSGLTDSTINKIESMDSTLSKSRSIDSTINKTESMDSTLSKSRSIDSTINKTESMDSLRKI